MAERVGVTVLLHRNTEQWHLFMCDKQVFALLTTVPYGTEGLSPCSVLTKQYPWMPSPALRLLPATPVATCLVDFLARAQKHLPGGYFFFLSCHPYGPVHKWCRLLSLWRWNRKVWGFGKHSGLMIYLENAVLSWCNQEVLVRSGISWHAWLVRHS